MDNLFLKIKRNQIIMLRDRGYDVSDEEWILNDDLVFKKFKKKLIEKYGEFPVRKLLFSEYTHPNKDKPLFVYYIGTENGKQIKVETIKNFLYKMTEENKDAILVIDTTLSPTAAECFNMITEHHYQIFKEEDLLYNIAHHVNGCHHELCNDEDVERLKKMGVNGKNCAWILHTDPIVQYYDFSIGSYVKINVYIDINVLNPYFCHYRLVI
jgi:DNA-directed RNA polymerase subunit H (RpoH/RPB5)